MNQTRIGSMIEAFMNIAIGFIINFVANMAILPLFGFTSLTMKTNLVIGAIYTVISVVRSYTVRRWFNARLHAAAVRLAGER